MLVPPETAITIESLPVSYGDALLVTCYAADRSPPWRMLVDTGPSKSWDLVSERIGRLPADETGVHTLDLFVVTHIDHDHIGAAEELIADPLIHCGDVWFNGEPQLPTRRSRREGKQLGALLDVSALGSWNATFDGRAVQALATPAAADLGQNPSAPNITVLAPNRKALTALARAWHKPPNDKATTRSRGDERGELANPTTLATRRFVEDRSVPNRSSIVLLVEHRGTSALLLGDTVPRLVKPAIKRLATKRGATLPMHVDVMKLSHHGSRRNTSADLLKTVRAQHYIVSTDASRHGLPNDESLAHLVNHPDSELWFNHDNQVTRRWDSSNSAWSSVAYRTHYPPDATAGAVLHLAARDA